MNILDDVWKEHIMPKLSIYQIRRLAIVNKEINKIVQPFLDERFQENATYDIIASVREFHINKRSMIGKVLKFNVGYYWDFGPLDIWQDDRKEFYKQWSNWQCDMKRCKGEHKGYRKCLICNNDKLIKASSVKKHRQTKTHLKNLETVSFTDKEENFINERHQIQLKTSTYKLCI